MVIDSIVVQDEYAKREPVDLPTVHYDVSLCQPIRWVYPGGLWGLAPPPPGSLKGCQKKGKGKKREKKTGGMEQETKRRQKVPVRDVPPPIF